MKLKPTKLSDIFDAVDINEQQLLEIFIRESKRRVDLMKQYEAERLAETIQIEADNRYMAAKLTNHNLIQESKRVFDKQESKILTMTPGIVKP